MAFDLWQPVDLVDLQRDVRYDDVPDYFLTTYYTEQHYSEDREILVAELPTAYRVMAPFVLPANQGKPIFKAKGEKAKSFTPPYLKPKDAVRPTEARNRRPSDLRTGNPSDLTSKFEARVAEVSAFHVRAIRMQEAWMAARGFIDGKVTIKYDAEQGLPYPEVIIDFGRNSNQTIILSGSFWSDPDYDIIGDLTTWSNLMYNATMGGRPTLCIVGSSVAPYIQKNKGILALLSTLNRGSEGTTMERGMMTVDRPMTKIATLSGVSGGLEIWTYKDVVEDNAGNMVDILDPKEVLLVAPGARGVRAYGAIYNHKALQSDQVSIDIFPSMFEDDDPPAIYLMHEASPLPIPLYPNRTLKARVLA